VQSSALLLEARKLIDRNDKHGIVVLFRNFPLIAFRGDETNNPLALMSKLWREEMLIISLDLLVDMRMTKNIILQIGEILSVAPPHKQELLNMIIKKALDGMCNNFGQLRPPTRRVSPTPDKRSRIKKAYGIVPDTD
jgi:hypothetical protein